LSKGNNPIQEHLAKIRSSLQKLTANEEIAPSAKKELADMVKQLDDILQLIKIEGFGIKQQEQKAVLERDLERELGRVRQTIKPNLENDPHRVD
jgi:hypothetical protein